MGNDKHGPETSYNERTHRRLQLVYSHKMQERQLFMDELKENRKLRSKKVMKLFRDQIGPRWYQPLSEPQRRALDSLDFAIHQDLLEGRPIRAYGIIKILGIYPRPSITDLMNCLYHSRDDSKELLAQLFLLSYGHPIDGKRLSYCLNARLLLSGILYLGFANLIQLLTECFRPDPQENKKPIKPKPKAEPPLASPYLQIMVAALYEPPQRKRFQPAPLPNLDDLNEPYEEEPPIPRPQPPPPPPPPPKKRLPRQYCDKLAGIMTLEPHHPSVTTTSLAMKTVTRTSHRKVRGSKICLTEVKKTYGISTTSRKKSVRKRKPVAPSTGMWNSQYMINGVFTVHGKTVFVLGSVSILPSDGELIHGGYKYVNGQCITIHCGFRAKPPMAKPQPCDCLKQWQDTVFQYVKRTKCYCGHHYDYGNEGTFLPDELQYFEKPTYHSPCKFNYHTIYNMNEKSLLIEKEFKRLWETDSMLHVDDGTQKDKKEKKKKKKRNSSTCLGEKPTPEDYLKCALRLMRRVNIAARLPDIHLVPELKEWMRRRIYGPPTHMQKLELLRKSTIFWQKLSSLARKGFGHVPVPKEKLFSGLTNWSHKQDLNDKFRKFTLKYRLSMYRAQAYVTNLTWRSMFQAELPDKKFREIYFSYLFERFENLQLIHPYCSREAIERMPLRSKRYICLPDGTEPSR